MDVYLYINRMKLKAKTQVLDYFVALLSQVIHIFLVWLKHMPGPDLTLVTMDQGFESPGEPLSSLCPDMTYTAEKDIK